MKLRISQQELQARSFFVATPCYGGMCYGLYANALLKLAVTAVEQGLKMQFAPVFNESLITRGRNTLANDFLKSGMTHLLMVDSDIEFTPEDALALLVLADPKSDKDVVCGLYPKKHIAWKKVSAAVEQGVPAEKLENYVGEMVFNPSGKEGSYSLYEPLDVKECGTGFMLIQRRVLEKFVETYTDLYYHSLEGDPSKTYAFFDTWIDPETHRYLSEDYNFCRLVRSLGMKVWVAPWLNINHMGYYKFIGNAGAVSSLAAAPRATHAQI